MNSKSTGSAMVTMKVSSCLCAVIPRSTDFMKWPILQELNNENSLPMSSVIHSMEAFMIMLCTSLDSAWSCRGVMMA
ncbi:hypothetical protein D3C80_1765200 [compost metagenome]